MWSSSLPSSTHAPASDRDTDPIVWIGVAFAAGALITTAPVPAAIVALLAYAWLWRSRAQRGMGRRAVAIVALICFGVSAVRAHRCVERFEAREAALVDRSDATWPSRCTIQGVVDRSPVLVGGALRISVRVTEARCSDVDVPALAAGGVLLYLARDNKTNIATSLDGSPPVMDSEALARGDTVRALASLSPPYRFWNDGTGDPRPGAARRGVLLSGSTDDVIVVRRGFGVTSLIDRARHRLRERIIETFPIETSPMARALVLGEDDLASDDQRAFRKSGLAHLLAVSGMHLVLVVVGFVAALRMLLVRIPRLAARGFDASRLAALAGVPIAWMYADLAGGSGSALRAAWMCSVLLLAHTLGRRSTPWRALGISLVVMALLDPLVIFDLSFVLSALATAGILLLAAPIEARMSRSAPWLPALVAKPLATTLAATISCAPVLALMAPDLPLGGLVANVVAVPIGEAAALPLCLVHGLLFAWPAAESGCAVAASGALQLVRVIARVFSSTALGIPAPTSEQVAAMAAMGLGLVLAVRSPRRVLLAGALALVVLEVVARSRGSPHDVLRVTFLDVGQGDSALIDFPDGSSMLVDGGGLVGSPVDVGERAVLPLLAARRRSAIDVVVLSHPHPDHYLGLDPVLARVPVKELWDTGQGEAEAPPSSSPSPSPSAPSSSSSTSAVAVLDRARARGVAVRRPSDVCGTHMFGAARVDVLAPCPRFVDDRNPNDNSFLLRIRLGERAFLLVGDAEREEEAEAVQRSDLRADVLKVGHHGSRTSSSSAFLEAVKPRVAVISCGVRNRFGHPHRATLDALRTANTRVLRTDRAGSVVITTDGQSLEVRTMREVP